MGLGQNTKSIIESAMISHEAFTRGNLTGRKVTPYLHHDLVTTCAFQQNFGMLPYPFNELLTRHLTAGHVTYVIQSYDTPVAWHLDDGDWIIPPVHYSTTTTQHVDVIREVVARDHIVAHVTVDPKFPAHTPINGTSYESRTVNYAGRWQQS